MLALVFPGQGAQKIGMSMDVVENFKVAQHTLEEIEEAISFEISDLIRNGSFEELTVTNNAQIAVFTASMVILNVLIKEFGFNKFSYVLGHSLGEYTALASSSVCSLFNMAKIVKKRGEIMSAIGKENKNLYSMAAILGLSVDKIEDILINGVVIANDNSSNQVVVSGISESITKVSERAIQIGAKKVIKLNTSGPFHSYFLEEAAQKLQEVLEESTFEKPNISIIMNLTASVLSEVSDLKKMMVQHITERVRWRESVEFVVNEGVTQIIEIGPGKVLTNLSKKDYPSVIMNGIENIAEIEDFVKNI